MQRRCSSSSAIISGPLRSSTRISIAVFGVHVGIWAKLTNCCIAWLALWPPISPGKDKHADGKNAADDGGHNEQRKWKCGARVRQPHGRRERANHNNRQQ